MAKRPATKTPKRRSRTSSRAAKPAPRGLARRYRMPLLWLAAFRIVMGIIAIPLAPVLYREHFLILVLMRPTKEVLLAGGFLARQGDTNLVTMVIAAVPLAIIGVWHSFALGRGFAPEIRTGKLPGLGTKILPVEKIKTMQKLLRRKGAKLVVIGRLAVFPSSLVGAAAGSSGMKTKLFLSADGVGGLLSIAEAIGAGYLLGEAFKEGKKWITVAGVLALGLMAFIVGRYLQKAD